GAGVVGAPDLGRDHVAQAVVDHRVQVHAVADGDHVGGQDGGEDRVVVVVVPELLGGIAAHGVRPLHTGSEVGGGGVQGCGRAPPPAADPGLLEAVTEDEECP